MGSCFTKNVGEPMETTEAQFSTEDLHASSSKFLRLCTSSTEMSESWQPPFSGFVIPEDLGATQCSAKSKFKQSNRFGPALTDDLGIPIPIIDRQSSSTMCSPWSTLQSLTGPPPITEVTSQLYFGSYEDAKNVEELRSLAITHILTLIGKKNAIAGIKHMQKPMHDLGRTDLRFLINNIWTFVEESQLPGNALFLHCMLGQNRSATVMIAILMKLHGQSLEEAFKRIKNKRPIVQINAVYAEQLSKLEHELHGRKSVSNNWMEIRRANMATGSVAFFGDSMISVKPLSRTKS